MNNQKNLVTEKDIRRNRITSRQICPIKYCLLFIPGQSSHWPGRFAPNFSYGINKTGRSKER